VEFLKSNCKLEDVADSIGLKASIYAATAYSVFTEMSLDEKLKLREMMVRTIEDCGQNPIKNSNDALDRVLKINGSAPRKNIIAPFLKTAILDNPLSLAEPHIFVEKWGLLSTKGGVVLNNKKND